MLNTKKTTHIAFTLLLITVLSLLISCIYSNDHLYSDFASNSSTSSTSSSLSDSNNTHQDDANLSNYDKMWIRFQNFIADNPYDKWLEFEKSEGMLTVKGMYGDYLKYWFAEYEFTLEYAKIFYENCDEYLSWKKDNEEWLQITRKLLNKEMNRFNDQMHQLEVMIPYSELIRQKVIDTKYFLYTLENDTASEITEYTSLQWKNIE